jgi:hypothetical protein
LRTSLAVSFYGETIFTSSYFSFFLEGVAFGSVRLLSLDCLSSYLFPKMKTFYAVKALVVQQAMMG